MYSGTPMVCLEIGRAVDLRVFPHEDAGVIEAPRREDRQADEPLVATRSG